MSNGFIGAVPKHPISKKMIDIILRNIKNKYYGEDPLSTTGPGAYIRAAEDYMNKFPDKCMIGDHAIEDGQQFIIYNNIRVIKVKYNNANGGNNTDITGTNSYSELWWISDIFVGSSVDSYILRLIKWIIHKVFMLLYRL